jgi:hypothetical protein
MSQVQVLESFHNMSSATASLRGKQPRQLDEGHWRAAAEEGLRLAAKRWGIPLANITEMALVDADGPRYTFKVLYTDALGQRCTGAVHMPKGMSYTSPLSMSSLWSGHGEPGHPHRQAVATLDEQLWPHAGFSH